MYFILLLCYDLLVNTLLEILATVLTELGMKTILPTSQL